MSVSQIIYVFGHCYMAHGLIALGEIVVSHRPRNNPHKRLCLLHSRGLYRVKT